MSEFCKDCPMRGQVEGEFDAAFLAEAQERRAFSKYHRELGMLAVVVDESRNLSEPVHAPSEDTVERVMSRIDDCTAPEIIQRGRIFKREQVYCPALSSLAIERPDVRSRFMNIARIETA